IAAFADELEKSRKERDAIHIGRAPELGAPFGLQGPCFMRVGREQVGEWVDSDGVVAALFQLVERLIPVFVAGTRPASLNPGELPHGDGARVFDAVECTYRLSSDDRR